MTDEDAPPSAAAPGAGGPHGRLREVALLFTRLGFTAFGGPAVHTALMEDEVVRRRRWLDREHFLDLVAALNFIPGPNSTELAIHLGLIRAGLPGLVVAGVCFIAPAVLIILPLAWLYVRHAGAGVRPPPAVAAALAGVGAVVVAVLAVAAWRFAGAAFKSRFTVAVAALTLPADLLLRRYTPVQSEIVILTTAAVAGVLWSRRSVGPTATMAGLVPVSLLPSFRWPSWNDDSVPPLARAATLLGPPAVGLASIGPAAGEFLRLGWFFLTVGGTLFGSGYVLVNYLETGLVAQLGWLTPQQLVDAVAVGQVTPGPLLTTATFVGYVRGHAVTGSDWGGVIGGLVATVAIFLPAFVLVAAFGRLLPRLRARPWARAALDAIDAAVAALLVLVTLRFAAANLAPGGQPDPFRAAVCAAALAAMLRWDVNATWLIVGGAVTGLVSQPG